jgi:hypothetical protein
VAQGNQVVSKSGEHIMKRMTTTLIAAALAITCMAIADDEPHNQQQHEQQNPSAFLQKLVGEWSVTSYAVMDPSQEPYRFEGKESARMLGQQWFVSEYKAEVEGQTLHSILTIGYDPAQEKFVATYVNAMQTQLWSYEGTLNDEGTMLTLKTEGPFMGDPNQTAEYRVVIERKDADQWTMGSQILVPGDGEWFEFLTFEYEREAEKAETQP